jgi:alpha-L-arabinofuranosidase
MVLQLPLRSPACETGAFGDVPVLGAAAVAPDEGGVRLFAVDRDQAMPVVLGVDVRSLPSLSASHVAISGDVRDAVNALSSPDCVVPKNARRPGTRRRPPAGRAAAAVLGQDRAVLAAAVPGAAVHVV